MGGGGGYVGLYSVGCCAGPLTRQCLFVCTLIFKIHGDEFLWRASGRSLRNGCVVVGISSI